MKVVEKMKSTRGFINFDERTNALIVRDSESSVELMADVVRSIDTITPQVMIETKVIETDVDNTDNLGVDWGLKVSGTGSALPISFPFVQTGGIFGKQGSAYVPVLSTPSTAPSFTYGTIDATGLTATLQILSSHSNTKLLSNPRVVTLDNQKSIFNVGLEYPLPNYTFNSQTGAEELNGFTYKPIGIIFEVTPHVNNAGLITLDLHPQISSMGPLVTLSAGSTSSAALTIPEINNQETQTRVMVENGKTLVIAGLISDSKVVTKTKVPLLGDIPWLGRLLFSKDNTEITRKELLIFLTPHIITVDKKPV
jgi:type IV pilus assembly protein PilQ